MTLIKAKEKKKMKTRSNMPLFVLEVSDVKALSNSQIDLLRCGDYLVKKDASGEHAYKVTFKSDTGMCLTYHDASVVETQSYDKVDGNWVYNSEDKSVLPVNGDAPYFENIVDKDGHKRFIEGEILGYSLPEDVVVDYGKWSLSGSHLLIVFALSIPNGTILAGGNKGKLTLPEWITNKIYPILGNYIDVKNFSFWASDTTAQSANFGLLKQSNDFYIYQLTSSITTDKDRKIRIAFDLLIDNE